ncbi:MAG: hypothetical protein H0V46_07035 [Sphingomonas sp.]|nr:hypothetical protein [Sphingomonas sp.]
MIETGAAVRRVPNLPFLPNDLLEARRPLPAIALGALIALIPSLGLAMLVQWLLPSGEGPQFGMDGMVAIIALVVVAPVVETLIMGTVLLVLLRLIGPTAAVLASAAGWGVAHSLAAPIWGLVIWWPFLIFSTLFVVWRNRSLSAAFAVPATVHALQNLGPALLIASGQAG